MFEVVDLFCGAGGMSLGLKMAGMTLRLGVDHNRNCLATYASNFPESSTILADVNSLSPRDILNSVHCRSNLVLAGCPPCQLFSQLHRSNAPVGPEIQSYIRLIKKVSPYCLVFENVPLIRSYPDVWNDRSTPPRRR